MEGWTVEALAEIPLRREWKRVIMEEEESRGSECVVIPYRHPLDGKMHNYIPDFLITYRTKNNTTRAELVEIKPRKQSILEEKMNSKERAIVAINYAKWASAQKWCNQQGLTFRVITEADIFHQGGKK
jgi:hypothetical protein